MNIRDHHCTQKLKVGTSYKNKKGNMHIRSTIKKVFFIYALCLSTVYCTVSSPSPIMSVKCKVKNQIQIDMDSSYNKDF
jgi:hypothetical protein